PVRLRPVTPSACNRNASRTRAAEYRALTPACQGSSPWRRTSSDHPLVAEMADAPVSETGARRACPFNSDRGDQSTCSTGHNRKEATMHQHHSHVLQL